MSENENKKLPKKTPIKTIGVCVIVFVLLLWATYPYIISFLNCYLSTSEKIPKLDLMTFGSSFGTFGDSFGALNTLFSGLAFAGIIISIFLQSEELKETRKEVVSQREEFEKQTNVFDKQLFENTFFQMLQLHNAIVDSITSDGKQGIKGRSALTDYFTQFKNLFDAIININKEVFSGRKAIHNLNQREQKNYDSYEKCLKPYNISSLEDLNPHKNIHKAYFKFHEHHNSQLGVYFRNIYQILKFVHESKVENKKFYTNIFRAQFSNDELVLLFLNCSCEELGAVKFKPLIEKYAFFEHLRQSFIPSADIGKYSVSAYGANNTLVTICNNSSQENNELSN